MTERQKERQVIDAGRQQTELSTADMATVERRSAAPGDEVKQMQADTVPIDAAPVPPSMPETGGGTAAQPTSLLVADETRDFRSRWDAIQTGFVDEPRRSVEQADSLVAEVMKRLAETFADERDKLEGQWSRGDNVSTEDLRIALQRYRSFFDRLLSM